MSFFIFVLILIVSFWIIRVGAIALELTGMEAERAKFQALSAFTGTGFTTREAESVVNHPQRRRIVSYLMILGNAGIISLIGTFFLSIQSHSWQAWGILLALIILLLVLYRIIAHTNISHRLTDAIRARLSRTQLVQLTLEEILHQQEGYGIARIVIPECSSIIGMTLADAQFPQQHVLVLSISREGHLMPIPSPAERLEALDELVCYGRLSAMQAILAKCLAPADTPPSAGHQPPAHMIHV